MLGRRQRNKKLDRFAEDLGTLLGRAEAKAAALYQQRIALAKELKNVQNRAAQMLAQVSGETHAAVAAAKQGYRKGEKLEAKRRKHSAATRAKMQKAAQKRWSKIKKAATTVAKTTGKAAREAVS